MLSEADEADGRAKVCFAFAAVRRGAGYSGGSSEEDEVRCRLRTGGGQARNTGRQLQGVENGETSACRPLVLAGVERSR